MSSGALLVRDSRTNRQYEIPIHRNAVQATDFKAVKGPSATGTDLADHVSGGLRVHDPGLQNTAVVETGISFSDHESGLLLFRGYTLEELWDDDFEDMLHLLVWGTRPTSLQREELSRLLAEEMLNVPESVVKAVQALPRTTSALPLLITGLASYLACMPETIPASTHANLYLGSSTRIDPDIVRTVSIYAVVFGLVRCHRRGISFTPASKENTYIENLFTMAGLVDPSTSRPDPVRLSCFRRFAMLNSEHGMALTTFSSLVAASSLTDPISCLISSLIAAYGPLHFGAAESAQSNLKEIGNPENVPAFIEEVKRGKRKLFGYGHRSYKGVDPRVRFIKSILEDIDMSTNPLFKVAETIEKLASPDEYFTTRKLYPNADFYGTFVFTGIGLEPDIIPAAMLSHRILGIMAHWREYMSEWSNLVRHEYCSPWYGDF